MRAAEDLSFEAATAVYETDRTGVFEADVHERWTVGDKPNGGYLLALLGRAARATGRGVDGPPWEALSSAITYLRPPDLGPAKVTTTLLRRGRSAAQVRAVLSQHDADMVEATFVLGGVRMSWAACRRSWVERRCVVDGAARGPLHLRSADGRGLS